MKVTIVQSKVYQSKNQNLDAIKDLLHQDLDTDLIVLPEMFLSPFDHQYFYTNSVSDGDDFFDVMKELSKKHQCYLVAGSVPEKDGEDYYNTSYVFDNHGEIVTKYRKIHLFEVTYPNGKTYKESDKIKSGNKVITFHLNQHTIGLMICFDIRFPFLSKTLQEKGATLLVVPAAFNQYTGPLHWELAFRSRAVDNQLFTLGVSPSSKSEGNYQYYGHSILVDPLGQILYQASGEEVSVSTIEIDLDQVHQVRTTLPILKNEVKSEEFQ